MFKWKVTEGLGHVISSQGREPAKGVEVLYELLKQQQVARVEGSLQRVSGHQHAQNVGEYGELARPRRAVRRVDVVFANVSIVFKALQPKDSKKRLQRRVGADSYRENFAQEALHLFIMRVGVHARLVALHIIHTPVKVVGLEAQGRKQRRGNFGGCAFNVKSRGDQRRVQIRIE